MSGLQLLQVCCVARAAGDIDRLLHGAQQAAARANALSAYVGGSTQHRFVVAVKITQGRS